MTSPREPRIDRHDAVSVVGVAGEVDLIQTQGLRERLFGAVRNEDLGLVIDLTDASYIDSVGVSLLFELAERLGERQLKLGVVLPEDGLVERVLTMVDLKSVAGVHRSADEAVRSIAG